MSVLFQLEIGRSWSDSPLDSSQGNLGVAVKYLGAFPVIAVEWRVLHKQVRELKKLVSSKYEKTSSIAYQLLGLIKYHRICMSNRVRRNQRETARA